jgi:hypothetical protein
MGIEPAAWAEKATGRYADVVSRVRTGNRHCVQRPMYWENFVFGTP